jgi:hypothetical protein
MREFGQQFLTEDPRRLGYAIFLAGFGKHPGWDDHIEDIGIATESLAIAKNLLYVEGIGGQINAGAWDKLGSDQQLATFKHVFVWQRAEQLLIGLVWSSVDGKGRARYPMIACAHCVGLSPQRVMERVLPRLREVQRLCQATKSPADVRDIFRRTQDDLRLQCRRTPGDQAVPDLSPDDRRQFLARPELGADQEGLYRILYQIHSQMKAYGPGRGAFRRSELPPRQLRLPACATSPSQAILLWSRLFASQLSFAAPRLFVAPDGEAWLDFVVGEPSSQECFCLRASPKVLPLASDVPYTLESQFRQQAQEFIVAFERGTDLPKRRGGAGLWAALICVLVLVIVLVAAYPWLVQQWPELGDNVNRLREMIGGH